MTFFDDYQIMQLFENSLAVDFSVWNLLTRIISYSYYSERLRAASRNQKHFLKFKLKGRFWVRPKGRQIFNDYYKNKNLTIRKTCNKTVNSHCFFPNFLNLINKKMICSLNFTAASSTIANSYTNHKLLLASDPLFKSNLDSLSDNAISLALASASSKVTGFELAALKITELDKW